MHLKRERDQIEIRGRERDLGQGEMQEWERETLKRKILKRERSQRERRE